VITGRGPGAPGITPGLEFTRRPGGPGGTGHAAVDLSEIRRSEELIDRLAAREALAGPGAERRAGGSGPGSPGDPAAALLAALSADVDVPALQDEPVMTPGRAAAGGAMSIPPSRGLAEWLRAAVAGAVVAGLAGTTSLITASMLARLSRGAGGRGRVPPRGWAPPARSRRYR
jgi:hypothetical protein